MKRFFIKLTALLLSVINLLFFRGYSSGHIKEGNEVMPVFDRYTLEAYSTPLWKGSIVCNETLMFVENEDGSVPAAPLLYYADEIISLRSFDLATEYEPGRDYNLVDGKIVLTENTRIYKWTYDEYYPASTETEFAKTKNGYIAFGEGDTFFKTQVAVTYRHSDEWDGIRPAVSDRLSGTLEKLKNGEPLTIVYYGDSITTGANSSRTQAPFAPMWSEMVTDMLEASFENAKITEINTAVGGTGSSWGVDELDSRVLDYHPDLVVLAFGMNDISLTPVDYSKNIKKMIDEIRKQNSEAEVILVSPMQPNSELPGFCGSQYTFEDALERVTLTYKGVAVAPIWSMHTKILESKRYYDSTGNNINHPNDFLARVYAQTVAGLLIDYEK